MTQSFGSAWSEAIGDAHEAWNFILGQPDNEMYMDLHNNAVGRNAASNGTSIPQAELIQQPPE
jgi:hypothetical protein